MFNTSNCSLEMFPEVLSKLKFIASIKSGEKISIETLTVRQDSVFNKLHRTILGRESRSKTFDFISISFHSGIDLVEKYQKLDSDIYKKMIDKIVEAIVSAKSGLDALMETYNTDRMFIAKIQSLIETIDIKILNFHSES